ncbi:MAG: IS3 family transposase [Bacillota bacterium]|nr:IS3 family transposase [Bacillota bacterium]
MKDSRLKELIAEIHSDSDGPYGAPKIHAALTLKLKIPCSKKRVARLMREVGLAGVDRRENVGCTKKDPARPVYPDLAQLSFTATEPNQLWVADITRHYTSAGWLYLAVIIDLFSRIIAGWFGSSQTELLDRYSWPTRSKLRSAIFEYFEAFYNRKRLHSSLGYLSPMEFEERWFNQVKLKVSA